MPRHRDNRRAFRRQALAAVGLTFLTLGVIAGQSARQGLSDDCATGDATLGAQARAMLRSPDVSRPLALGYLVAATKLARGRCSDADIPR